MEREIISRRLSRPAEPPVNPSTKMIAISAIVPTCHRMDELRKTLRRINDCDPTPSEILVHVDGSHPEVLALLESEFPAVRTVSSIPSLGPGGSRNRLIHEASHPWIANFDDDSFPVDRGYFARIAENISTFPDTAIFSATTVHDETAPPLESPAGIPKKVPVFSGCGCVYNKSWYLKTWGYVPLPVAYGMEEVDLSLQLYALAGKILEIPQLRVFHHDPYAATPSNEVLACSIANIALFGFLRYPVVLWPFVPLQIFSRILWAVRRGWSGGIFSGLTMIPCHLAKYAKYRNPIAATKALSWVRQRHEKPLSENHPVPGT